MHRPLLDRAHANAGGNGYDFTPFFKSIAPVLHERVSTLAVP